MSDEQDALQSIPDAAEPVPSPAPSEAPPGGTEKLHWTNENAEADYTAHFAKAAVPRPFPTVSARRLVGGLSRPWFGFSSGYHRLTCAARSMPDSSTAVG
jgi:hypothetical protein